MVKYFNTWIGVQIQVKYFDTPHPNSRCFETVLIPEYTVCKLNNSTPQRKSATLPLATKGATSPSSMF